MYVSKQNAMRLAHLLARTPLPDESAKQTWLHIVDMLAQFIVAEAHMHEFFYEAGYRRIKEGMK